MLHPLVPISSDELTSLFPSFMQFSQQEGSDTGIMEGESNSAALSTSEQKCENCPGEWRFSAVTPCARALLLLPQCDMLSSASAECWRRVLGD